MSELNELRRGDFCAWAVEPAKVEPLTIPGRGQAYLRVMSGSELDQYEQENYAMDPKTGKVSFSTKDMRARLAVLCLCDANGNRLFTNLGEASLIGRMPAPILDMIFGAAQKLNGLDAAAREAKEKNSSSQAAAGAPGSDSPATSA